MIRELFFKMLTTVSACVSTTLLGGWSNALEILLIFITMDYLTGLTAAFKSKKVQSAIGLVGLCKKGTIFFVVVLAAQLDRITGNGADVFRTATAFFFIANEGISIMENVAEIGVKLPGFLLSALKKIRDTHGDTDKGDDSNDE